MAHLRTIAALAALAGLAACATPDRGHPALNNHSLNSVNQPVVHRTDYLLDLSSGPGGLAASEAGRLGAWFDMLGIGYGDRVWVEGAHGQDGGQARADIARVAGAYGLLVGEGAPVTAGHVQPGTVRVIVSRTVATVPDCPNWGDAARIGMPARTSPNYGCATNSNLAAMIADPNDLVLGQAGAASGDPSTATKAIRTYRDAPTTGSKGLPATITTGGK